MLTMQAMIPILHLLNQQLNILLRKRLLAFMYKTVVSYLSVLKHFYRLIPGQSAILHFASL